SNGLAQLSRVVGPGLGGLVFALTSAEVCFALNAVSFGALIGAMFLMRKDELYTPERVVRAKGQIREGLRYIWRTPALRSAISIMAVVGMLAFEFGIVLPFMTKVTFHGGPTEYSWIATAMGIGALCGALFVASRGRASGAMMVAVTIFFGIW